MTQFHPPERYKLAIDSLDQEVTLIELSYMLIQACEEVMEEGKKPETDPAVALISGRIGFASPADSLSSESWEKLIYICQNGLQATLELRSNATQ